MTIGKKLKKAREDASLTQQQLSQGIVTRNMLSQIENDRATPSLDTLSSLADRLGIKLSYFLCDDDDNYAIMKESVLAKLRSRIKKREYNDCLDLLYRMDIRDDELRYISALCHYHSALDDYRRGKLTAAKSSFLNALHDAESTVYPADSLKRNAQSYIDFISSIHITTDGIKSDSFVNSYSNSSDVVELWYIEMLLAIERGEHDFVRSCLERSVKPSFYSAHIKAKLMAKESPDSALDILLGVFREDIGTLMRYAILCDLESIYLMKKDYEKAFNCSSEKQKVLSTIK